MATFTVPDMVCSGCVKAITASVHRVDPAARVATDLATHRVEIESGKPEAVLAEAIGSAGFTAQAS
jgi:copper chaperone